MVTSAQSFFDSFRDKRSIKDAIKRNQEEGIYLEFKEKKDRSKPELDKEDKRNFADGLSMFANSDGGVQVWGVETKRSPNDIAVKSKPINRVKIFVNNLREYLKDAVVPSVDGVIIEEIIENQETKSGFVKILIPQSDKTPHRSQFSREYLKRSQTGKVKLEHFDLEDMFGRRQRAYLTLEFLNQKMVDEEIGKKNITFDLYLNNNGRAIGRDAMVVLFCPTEDIMSVKLSLTNIQIHSIDDIHKKPTYQLNLRNSLFYPTVNTRLGQLAITLNRENFSEDETTISWVVYADNMMPKNGGFKLIKSST